MNFDIELFKKLCSFDEQTILQFMCGYLKKKKYKNLYRTKDFVYAKGDVPIGIVVHADTVFPSPPTLISYDPVENLVWSPNGLGADDRAGIYLVIELLRHTDLRPSVFITTGEERGGEGAIALLERLPNPNLNFLIQLDRRGCGESVFYECGNADFQKYINSFGFETRPGTFTDISFLGPRWDTAAVNLSVGYMNEHTYREFLLTDWMLETLEKVIKILETPSQKYDYQEDFLAKFRFHNVGPEIFANKGDV